MLQKPLYIGHKSYRPYSGYTGNTPWMGLSFTPIHSRKHAYFLSVSLSVSLSYTYPHTINQSSIFYCYHSRAALNYLYCDYVLCEKKEEPRDTISFSQAFHGLTAVLKLDLNLVCNRKYVFGPHQFAVHALDKWNQTFNMATRPLWWYNTYQVLAINDNLYWLHLYGLQHPSRRWSEPLAYSSSDLHGHGTLRSPVCVCMCVHK